MAVTTTAAIAAIGLGVTAVGTIAGIRAGQRAADAQEKAAKLSEGQQKLAERRSRRQAIRQAQLARAQAVASASASGAMDSSSARGGIGAISSQLGSQLSFGSQMSGFSQGINRANRDAMEAGAQADLYGQVAGFGGSLFSAAGGFGAFESRQPRTPPQFNNVSGYTP